MNNDNVLPASYYKLRTPNRNQIEFQICCLNDLLPLEHKARIVWDFVEAMDTSICLEYINTFNGAVGRPTVDPKILLALWIYTILDGNCSARKLDELCQNHDIYKWICGGVSVNRTMLADFRSHHPRKFDELLTNCLAVMVKSGLINDSDFSQDGTRVKANAGFNSFRREESLKDLQANLTEYIKQLKAEEKTNPNAYEERQRAEKERTAIEKKNRVKAALENLEEARSEKMKNGTKHRDTPTDEELKEVRASTTDPDVRKMKMGDNGFRLAYNVQFATGLDSRVIYGVDVVKTLDPGTACKMIAQVQERLKKLLLDPIKNWIADSAYSGKDDIDIVALLFPHCRYYAPPKTRKGTDPKKVQRYDSEAVKKWRGMIGSEEVLDVYKKRCSTAEFSNAQVKNQSLQKFSVRGLIKAKGIALLHAIAQNLSRYIDLFGEKVGKINL
jgi:transposase